MNPVTRHLLDSIDDPELADFALAWDALEEILVSVSRAGAVSKESQDDFERRRRSAARLQPRFATALEPLWHETRIDGAPVRDDPFVRVLRLTDPGEVNRDRGLLRLLPPARESLNHLLLARAVD